MSFHSVGERLLCCQPDWRKEAGLGGEDMRQYKYQLNEVDQHYMHLHKSKNNRNMEIGKSWQLKPRILLN